MTNNLTPQQLIELEQNVLAICSILGLQIPVAHATAVAYPSATKAQLAKAANAQPRTFSRWLRKHRDSLDSLGVNKTAKKLPPEAVKYICECLEIDISNLQEKI